MNTKVHNVLFSDVHEFLVEVERQQLPEGHVLRFTTVHQQEPDMPMLWHVHLKAGFLSEVAGEGVVRLAVYCGDLMGSAEEGPNKKTWDRTKEIAAQIDEVVRALHLRGRGGLYE